MVLLVGFLVSTPTFYLIHIILFFIFSNFVLDSKYIFINYISAFTLRYVVNEWERLQFDTQIFFI